MREFTVGVMTVSDRCAAGQVVDQSGTNLIEMIKRGVIKNAAVVENCIVPDETIQIQDKLIEWCDVKNLHFIITTGGTGLSSRDVTPESTLSVIQKKVPGILHLMLKNSLEITPLAALTRAIAGVRGKTLIINLPGSVKASTECLESIAKVIPHALDLILDNKETSEKLHLALQCTKSCINVLPASERTRVSKYPQVNVKNAQEIVIRKSNLLKKKITISLDECCGFVLAENVIALDDLPPVDVSLKDGYAVLSSDNQSVKKVVGCFTAGMNLDDKVLEPGYCVRVSTGVAIPKGANAVVQVEDTKIITLNEMKEEEEIFFSKLPQENQDIRKKGYDYEKGDELLLSNTFLSPSAVGVLAAAGITSVTVYAKPVIGILSTGDELVDPKEKMQNGKVRDSNSVTLINIFKMKNFTVKHFGIVEDDVNALFNALKKAFSTTDVVVTSGGMSMGEKDYIKEVLIQDFKADISFGRVSLKPGQPTGFGVVEFEGKTKLWFGLPGNPASAFVTAHLFVLPALKKAMGFVNCLPKQIEISRDLLDTINIPTVNRPQYIRGFLTFDCKMQPVKFTVFPKQNSSRIASCVNANCFLIIPNNIVRQKDLYNVIIIDENSM